MLFDLESDPQELHDLAVDRPEDPATMDVIARCRRILYDLCCPEAVDARAKSDQRAFRAELDATGQLAEEMHKRGYQRSNTAELVTRREILPKWMQ